MEVLDALEDVGGEWVKCFYGEWLEPTSVSLCISKQLLFPDPGKNWDMYSSWNSSRKPLEKERLCTTENRDEISYETLECL